MLDFRNFEMFSGMLQFYNPGSVSGTLKCSVGCCSSTIQGLFQELWNVQWDVAVLPSSVCFRNFEMFSGMLQFYHPVSVSGTLKCSVGCCSSTIQCLFQELWNVQWDVAVLQSRVCFRNFEMFSGMLQFYNPGSVSGTLKCSVGCCSSTIQGLFQELWNVQWDVAVLPSRVCFRNFEMFSGMLQFYHPVSVSGTLKCSVGCCSSTIQCLFQGLWNVQWDVAVLPSRVCFREWKQRRNASRCHRKPLLDQKNSTLESQWVVICKQVRTCV